MFASGHASKNAKVDNVKVENSIAPPFPPCNIIIPPNYYYPSAMIPHNPMYCPSSSSQNIPSLYDFLHALDEQEGGGNIFKCLETFFQEEGIKVTYIKDLINSQLVKLGVTKVGWQITLKQTLAKYIQSNLR